MRKILTMGATNSGGHAHLERDPGLVLRQDEENGSKRDELPHVLVENVAGEGEGARGRLRARARLGDEGWR